MQEVIDTRVQIPLELKEKVEKLALLQNLPINTVMIRALSNYIDQMDKRKEFLQSGIKSWEKYQETGLHVTSDEVHEWIKELGNNPNKVAPKCHK